MLPWNLHRGLGQTQVNPGLEPEQAILVEAMITFLLVLVVHALTDPNRNDVQGWAPLGIGEKNHNNNV